VTHYSNGTHAHRPRNRLDQCAGLPTCTPAHLCDHCRNRWRHEKEQRQQRDQGDTQNAERRTQNTPPLKGATQPLPCDEFRRSRYHVPDFLRAVWEAAQQMEPPAIAARYILPGIRKLILLCYALQQTVGKGTWFLACRHAAELIGAPFPTVSRWLGRLEHDGVLDRVSTGTVGVSPESRANEYCYTGGGRTA
jgi:hypothetical protein